MNIKGNFNQIVSKLNEKINNIIPLDIPRIPEPSIKEPCYFCYNGECFAKHWYECSRGFLHNKKRETMIGNKRNSYCNKDK